MQQIRSYLEYVAMQPIRLLYKSVFLSFVHGLMMLSVFKAKENNVIEWLVIKNWKDMKISGHLSLIYDTFS